MKFTNVPVDTAACPECGGQIQVAMAKNLKDVEPNTYTVVIFGVAVACCSLDDGSHLYAADDWESTRQQLVQWIHGG